MAYVVARPSGGWELRESVNGPRGPRSRTLVGFRSLGPAEIDQALERAEVAVTRDDLLAAARRAGAPVSLEPTRAAAAELLAGLARGGELPDTWRSALSELLGGDRPGTPSTGSTGAENRLAAAMWANASLTRRGEALWDLLLLADRIGAAPRMPRAAFPGLNTTGG